MTAPEIKWIDLETDVIPAGEQTGFICLEITGRIDTLSAMMNSALGGDTFREALGLNRIIVIRIRNDEE